MLLVHFQGHFWQLWQIEAHPPPSWIYILYLLIYYICFHFVSLLINGGLLIYEWAKFNGESISISRAIYLSTKRWFLIISWMFVFSFINIFMLFFESPTNWLGKISSRLFGLTWWMSISFVFPVIILEQKNPFSALRTSASLIKKLWGERVSRRLSFGFVYWIFLLPLILLLYLIFITSSVKVRMILSGVVVIYVVVTAILHSISYAFFQLSLYGYTKVGKPLDGIQSDWLDNVYW